VIEHIEIEGFRSLRKVSLDPFNRFIGANASGKSIFSRHCGCCRAFRTVYD